MLNFSNVTCGIDFGTSNSSIAISCDKQKPVLINVEDNKPTIPSAIFYSADSMQANYGNQAINAYVEGNEGRFMRSLKRVLGTDLMDAGTIINGKVMSFENILAGYIKLLKNKAEEASSSEITSVVMGRPVHFRDNDEKGDVKAAEQLKNIAKSVGFKNVEFQFEPIAGAYAHEQFIDKEILACVVDIGGGTSDFSIIKLGKSLQSKTDRTSDVLANTGVRIGGNDFDKDLSINCFMPELGMKTTYGQKALPVPTSQYFDLAEWSKINSVYNYKNIKIIKEVLSNAHDEQKYQRLLDIVEKEQGHVLLKYVEDTKIELTEQNKLEKVLKFLSDKPKVIVHKSDFEKSIITDLNKVMLSLDECVNLAGVKSSDIGLVVLTGGSTAIPMVENTIKQYFVNAKISGENKLSSVGLGLAFDSLRRF